VAVSPLLQPKAPAIKTPAQVIQSTIKEGNKMLDVQVEFTFKDKEGGAEVKPPLVMSWESVDKNSVMELEASLVRWMEKLNNIATATAEGKLPKPPNTNPIYVSCECEVTEGDALWTRTTFEWPNLGEEAQAMMIGIAEGELSIVGQHVKKQRSTNPLTKKQKKEKKEKKA
jgi:hypothetical protein